MQKIKFQIKGMHCASCVTLIEDRLKRENGVEQAKVNLESQKAVVIYDEQKIQEPAILQCIKNAGDYSVEKITEPEENKEASLVAHNSSSPAASLKLLTALVVISCGLSLASLIVSLTALPQKTVGDSNKVQAAPTQNLPSAGNGAAKIQTFEITKDNHVRGNFNAPVTLVEFSDFECPFCERIFPTMNKILNDYDGKVRLVYKQFPLSFHPNAQKAAEASECASEQGKFWEYHDKLFEGQPSGFSVDKFKQWAGVLGLNAAQFNSCLDGGKYAQKVQKDFQEGQQKGVNGTPATFVNGQFVSGAQPYENFKQIIDNLLK
ncbi:MAG: thioredoxin domain-containing protein [Patescibacteria group bacterium]